MTVDSRRLRIGYVMSTEVGMKTFYLNWRGGLTPEMRVDPEWIIINWWKPDGLLEQLPLVPGGVKSRLRAMQELHAGLRQGPFDALFVQVASLLLGRWDILRRQPYFYAGDSTPKQLTAFGDLYKRRLPSPRREGQLRRFWQEARALFPWSHWAAQSMIADYGADPSRVHVIPPGIDVAAWHVPQRAPTDPDGNAHLLFVGGDFHRKGGDLLLEWAKRTSATHWRLHLVTRDAIPQQRNVQVYNDLSPNDARLQALYRQAHVFVLPTRGDCYSLAGMEALASGLPVILGETGGTGDVIKEGETGFLIRAGDGEGLADRLDWLLAHAETRQAMGRAARLDAETRYDARKNVQQTLDIVRAALPE